MGRKLFRKNMQARANPRFPALELVEVKAPARKEIAIALARPPIVGPAAGHERALAALNLMFPTAAVSIKDLDVSSREPGSR